MLTINRKHLMSASNDETIGLIYSRSDLNHYFLEVISANSSNYVKEREELKIFNSVEQVSAYAKKAGCDSQYLCFDNTYDEFCNLPSTSQRFSYVKISG